MSGYFRGRLNTAAARARSQLVRIGLAIGPEFVWESSTFAVVQARSQSVRSGRNDCRTENSRNWSEPIGSRTLGGLEKPLAGAGGKATWQRWGIYTFFERFVARDAFRGRLLTAALEASFRCY